MDIIELNDKVFYVKELLGKGKGGYSYMVSDKEGELYTLKQIHHEPCSYYTFGDKLASELNDYQRLKAIGIPMPNLLEVDRERERILKEYVEGPTAMELVLRGKMRSDYIDQIRNMCSVLYPAHLNIDYFPTNFILSDNGRLIYIDFECNEYMERWDFEHWGVLYWSQTPELLSYAREHGLFVNVN